MDLTQGLYIIAGLKIDNEAKTTEQEKSLNLIVRVAQVFSAVFLYFVGRLYCDHLRLKRKRENEASRILNQFEKSTAITWAQNQESEQQSTESTCSFCLMEYEQEDELVQLKCHRNHLYHRECFKSFLEHIKG